VRATKAKAIRKRIYGNRSKRLHQFGPWKYNYKKLPSGQVVLLNLERRIYQFEKGRRIDYQ